GGKLPQAAAQYTTALRHKPTFFEAQYNLATALNRLGKSPEAVVEYRKAVRLKPGFGPAHLDLGVVLWKLGRHAEARDAFAEGARRAPKWPPAHLSLGVIGAPWGQGERAAPAVARGVELGPGSFPGWSPGAGLSPRAGGGAGHRRGCAAVLKRFGKADRPGLAAGLARPCLLAPGAVPDL